MDEISKYTMQSYMVCTVTYTKYTTVSSFFSKSETYEKVKLR